MDPKIPYLAGIIDGEGCFTVSHASNRRSYHSRLVIASTDRRLVDWLHINFHGNTCKPSSPRGNRAESYHWYLLKRADFVRLLPNVIPFLIIKKMHACIVLEFCQKFGHPYGVPYSEAELEDMQGYYDLMRLANSTGPGSSEIKDTLRNRILQVVN